MNCTLKTLQSQLDPQPPRPPRHTPPLPVRPHRLVGEREPDGEIGGREFTATRGAVEALLERVLTAVTPIAGEG